MFPEELVIQTIGHCRRAIWKTPRSQVGSHVLFGDDARRMIEAISHGRLIYPGSTHQRLGSFANAAGELVWVRLLKLRQEQLHR